MSDEFIQGLVVIGSSVALVCIVLWMIHEVRDIKNHLKKLEDSNKK